MMDYKIIIKYYTDHTNCTVQFVPIYNTNFLKLLLLQFKKKKEERKFTIVFIERCDKIPQNRETLQIVMKLEILKILLFISKTIYI